MTIITFAIILPRNVVLKEHLYIRFFTRNEDAGGLSREYVLRIPSVS